MTNIFASEDDYDVLKILATQSSMSSPIIYSPWLKVQWEILGIFECI
jgi:hypothetical protein